jgi:hypothetical protein
MTKLLLAACALLLLVTAVGVGRTNPKELKIALVLWRGETEAEQGFRDNLKELGYEAQYTVMNAGQDRSELGRLLREDLKPRLAGFDYVYVFGTTATVAAKSIVQDKVPIIFNVVADPVGAGIVKSMDASGGNLAGVTNEIPLALQLQTALSLSRSRSSGSSSILARRTPCSCARSWSRSRGPWASRWSICDRRRRRTCSRTTSASFVTGPSPSTRCTCRPTASSCRNRS